MYRGILFANLGLNRWKIMNKEKLNKITFVCSLTAALGFYFSAIIGVLSKAESPIVPHFLLGSVFMLYAAYHIITKKDSKK